jgi:hypothetical protein
MTNRCPSSGLNSGPAMKHTFSWVYDSRWMEETSPTIISSSFNSVLIGALQWLVTLGCFDIHLGVATMSFFCVALRQGYLDRRKRMFGYLKRNLTGETRFRVKITNHKQIATPIQYDWSSSIFGNFKEELPPDMPMPTYIMTLSLVGPRLVPTILLYSQKLLVGSIFGH